MADDLEVAGNHVQHLGDILAEFAHRAATVRTAATRRLVHDRLARQVGGERAWRAPQGQHALLRWRLRRVFRRHCRVLRVIGRQRRALQVVQRKLQLRQCGVEPFR
jgi:hypothetical protein